MSIQWPLVFFTLFMCAAAGVIGGTGILVVRGKGRKLYMPALILSVILIVLGGLSSFLHLERIFNGFGNLTSGITQELIAIVLAVIVLVVFFSMVRRTDEDQPVKAWIGWVMILLALALAVVCALSYLMVSRPAWSNAVEVLYFVFGTTLLGGVLLWVLAALKDETLSGAATMVTIIAGIIAAVVVVLFAVVALNAKFSVPMAYYDPVTPTLHLPAGNEAITGVLLGSNALTFWGGALVLGTIVPVILAFIARKAKSADKAPAITAALCALVGGICFRMVFYLLGFSVFGIF